MRKNITMGAAVMAAIFFVTTMAAAGGPLPEGWIGGNLNDYEVGVEKKVAKEGGSSAYIKAKTKTPGNFGTLMQTFGAEQYLDKRVRMSAFVKAEDITSWAGLWMRVDGEGKDKIALSFDNMQTRPIKGTLDWAKYEIVLDVPDESKSITFGILLDGPGQAWIDGFKFEEVSKDVPVTGNFGNEAPGAPRNLSFED